MTILYVLVPLGLALCLLGVWAFFWAVNTGQFENLETAAVSPLEEDSGDPAPAPSARGGPPTGSPSSP
jgi:cbb3-type cytochrome oxidase maturation protein